MSLFKFWQYVINTKRFSKVRDAILKISEQSEIRVRSDNCASDSVSLSADVIVIQFFERFRAESKSDKQLSSVSFPGHQIPTF